MSSKPSLDGLSKFEWTIMNQLWEAEKASAREIVEALPEESKRAYTTIQTYLERLVDKGYLTKEKIGMVNFYAPLVERDSIVAGATTSFIDRVFSGSGSSLAAYLLKNKNLKPEELEQIRDILGGKND